VVLFFLRHISDLSENNKEVIVFVENKFLEQVMMGGGF